MNLGLVREQDVDGSSPCREGPLEFPGRSVYRDVALKMNAQFIPSRYRPGLRSIGGPKLARVEMHEGHRASKPSFLRAVAGFRWTLSFERGIPFRV